MKNMNDLKSYLMKIIRRMSNKNITLNATLEELNIPIFEFLQKIRLDINILDNFTKDTIMTLMNTLDTKISFNPNAEDPRDEEIEIYKEKMIYIFKTIGKKLTDEEKLKKATWIKVFIDNSNEEYERVSNFYIRTKLFNTTEIYLEQTIIILDVILKSHT